MSVDSYFKHINTAESLKSIANAIHVCKQISSIILYCPKHEYVQVFQQNFDLITAWLTNCGIVRSKIQVRHDPPTDSELKNTQQVWMWIHHLTHIRKTPYVIVLQTEQQTVHVGQCLLRIEYSPFYYFQQLKEPQIACLPIMWRIPAPIPLPHAFVSFEKREFDILFVGSPSPRRNQHIGHLVEQGFTVHWPQGGYIWPLFNDTLVQALLKARVFLNITYGDPRALETHRITTAAAQPTVVVSEKGQDTALQEFMNDAVVFTALNDLVATLRIYCKNKESWQAQIEKQDSFWKRSRIERVLNKF